MRLGMRQVATTVPKPRSFGWRRIGLSDWPGWTGVGAMHGLGSPISPPGSRSVASQGVEVDNWALSRVGYRESPIATNAVQLNEQARRLMRAGDLRGAREIYAKLAKLEPKNAGYVGQLGSLQTQTGDPASGRRSLQKAVRLNPRSANLLHELAFALRGCGELEQAIDVAEQGLAIEPDHEYLIAAKSDFLWTSGRHDEAWALIEPAVRRGLNGPAIAVAFARVCEAHGERERGIELLQQNVARGGVGSADREAHFRLGELLDRAGRYEEAFEAFKRGNELVPGRHDAGAMSRGVNAVIEAWSPGAVESAPSAGFATELPIFVVGMPRSGTTLVEQILSSHPQIAAGGERKFVMNLAGELSGSSGGLPGCPAPERLSQGALDRSARSFERDLRKVDRTALRVTDKQPLNFLYLGLIDRMLPKARVIHCARDPMDTCISCYFTDFAGSIPVAADLSALGSMYRDYRRLMEHWRAVTSVETLDINYETLVDDLEGQARLMIGFVGLPWDDACVDFHRSSRVAMTASVQQVRKPIYRSSIGRHRNYETQLGRLREALGECCKD